MLFSWWYYGADRTVAHIADALNARPDGADPVRVLIDSGAFSAWSLGSKTLTTNGYAAWLTNSALPAWGDRVVGALNLDVIYDAAASWANWVALRDAGVDTIPIVHCDDTPDLLDRYVDTGADYVALSPGVKRNVAHKTGWSALLLRHLRDRHPHVRAHGLGVTAGSPLSRLPFWSIDSSSFGSVYRFAQAQFYDPARRGWVRVVSDGTADPHRHGRLLRDVYGIDPSDARAVNAANRGRLARAVASGVQMWEADARARWPVTPPASLARHGNGPHHHWADTAPVVIAEILAEPDGRTT